MNNALKSVSVRVDVTYMTNKLKEVEELNKNYSLAQACMCSPAKS